MPTATGEEKAKQSNKPPPKSNCPFKKGEIFECTPEKISLSGKAIYKKDDFVIFIKGAVPHQTIKAKIKKIKHNYAEAIVEEVVKKASYEIKPKCAHANVCGGCSWQHVPYEKQLEMKEQAVRELLETQGGLSGFTFMPIMPSPEIWQYRNKMEFSFGYESMEVEVKDNGKRIYHDNNPSIGMHRKEQWQTIVPLDECHLVSSELFSILLLFKKFVRDSKLPVYNPKTHRGFWRQLILREGKRTDQIMVHLVVTDKEHLLRGKGQKLLNEIIMGLQKKRKVKSVLLSENKGVSDYSGNLKHEVIWGEPCIHDKIGEFTFKISPCSFFQTNTAGAEKLYQVVADFAELTGKETVLDLYCGTGTIGLFLASRAKWVYGVEANKSAVRDATDNAKLNHFPNTTFFCGMIEKTLYRYISRIESLDVVVIDPPRAGMHKKALDTIMSAKAKRIVYISCNPVTMTRDIKQLVTQGYKLDKVQTLDMFPHTTHIETVALLTQV